MPAALKILGTRLSINAVMHSQQTVITLKQLIQTLYGVPIPRLTFRLFDGRQLMANDQTLENYGILDGHQVRLLLSVEPVPDVPITVFLKSTNQQFANWQAEVRCRETTTLAEFKRLVEDQLPWARPNGIAIYRGGFDGPIDVEGNMGCMVREFLIVNFSGVWVKFPANIPLAAAAAAAL